MANSRGVPAQKLDEQTAKMERVGSTAEAVTAYDAALRITDPRQQIRARFAALMALAEARGG